MRLLIIDFFIIMMIYILPFLIFIRSVNFDKYNLVKKFLLVIIYMGLYCLIPSMYDNILPFILIIVTIVNWKNNNKYKCDFQYYGFSMKEFNLKKAIKYVFITYIFIYLASIMSLLVMWSLNLEFQRQEIVTTLDQFNIAKFIFTIPFTVIFAPVVEEFTFRYLLFVKYLRNKDGLRLPFFIAAAMVSFLFAAVHNSLSVFPLLFSISFYNCYLAEKKGFWYAVFVHIFVNGISIFALLLNKLF